MKRDLKIYGLLAVIAAGAAAYAWHAWDTGLIPGNPRAPTKENFQRSIVEALAVGAPEPTLCHGLGMHNLRGEENYSNGAQNNPGQGIFGITLAPEIGGGERMRNIEMLSALAKSGYYTETDTSYTDESGTKRAAKRFQMTLAGWYNTGPMQCVQVGQRAFSGITKTAKLETSDGTTAYEIVFDMKVPQLPAWTKVENAEGIFRQLKTLSAPVERNAKLVRTSSGWEVRFAKAPVPNNGSAAMAPSQYVDSAPGLKAPKPPTLAEASKAFAAGIYANPSASLACLMLPTQQHMADEVGDFSNTDREKPYFATYYDDPSRGPLTNRQRIDGLGLMRALQAIGMVEEEIASDMALNGQRYAGGAVFRLKQKYKLLLDPRMPGCLPIAALTPEVKTMRITNVSANAAGEPSYSVEVTGVGKLKDVQPWVTETGADKQVAMIKWMLAEGVPISGSMRYGPKPEFNGANGYAARPMFATTEQPLVLFAGLTRFHPPGSGAPGGVGDGNETHAIVIYEGKKTRANPGGMLPQEEGVVTVNVGRTSLPVELYLSSYEPVLWRLTLEPGARVKRIAAVGYYPQRVIGAPAGIPVEGNHPPLPKGTMTPVSYNDPRAISTALRSMTKAPVRSVQTTYTGIAFGVGETRTSTQNSSGSSNFVQGANGGSGLSVTDPRLRTGRSSLSIIRCGNSTIVCGEQSESIMCNGKRIACR